MTTLFRKVVYIMYTIIGANGYLGTYMIKNILERTDETILAVARHIGKPQNRRINWVACDITKADEVERLNREYLSKCNKNKIVYLAAYHHPDLVEQNPRIAWDVNVTALARFLNIAENVHCFYYPSSDSVYGESLAEYAFKETDILAPVNRYGRHKCIAEKLVIGYGYNVVRFPFLIAPSLVAGRKHFYDLIVDTLTQGKTMEMFSDSYRSVLHFDAAAMLTIEIMETYKTEYPSILNVCGDDALSKYDVGCMIADKIGMPRRLIKPISIKTNTGIFQAKRASSTVMDNTLLKQTLGLKEVKFVP